MKKCPFCNINKDDIVMENELCFAIYDKFPVNPGHTLIIPKRHFPDYFSATMDEKIAIINLIEEVKQLLDTKFTPDGYNLGVNIGELAGQTIFHVHYHVIPRYQGDIENPRGGVRGVIPSKRMYKNE
jgi:diadenosine tetraphosphate (Ap4A) HIT family hydrolase